MKTLEFNDDKIKAEYKVFESTHPVLSKIIKILQEEKGKLKVDDIINDIYYNQIIISSNEGLINLYIDFINKIIKVIDLNKPYAICYEDSFREKIKPIGFEYENDKMIIFKKNINFINDDEMKKCFYEITDKETNKEYTMILSYLNAVFHEEDFINYVLNRCEIDNIRKLFVSLSKYLNFNMFNLKLSDSISSTIVMENGELTNYLEFQETDHKYARIYLENNEFYIEKVVKDHYNDASLNLVKEIGGFDGKEKK